MQQRTIPRWGILDLEFPCRGNFENPFTQVWLRLCFTKGSRQWAIDGFYDGEESGCHLFRGRFSPMEEGEWHWESFSNVAELAGQTGRFVCGGTTGESPLCINPQFPNWFAKSNGEPLHIVNDGWYPHPLFGDTLDFEQLEFPSPSEEDMRLYLDLLGSHGVNMTIEVDQLYARQSRVTDSSFNWPWKPLESGRIDPERFNLDYYRRMERTLAHAATQGVYYGLELLFDNSVFRPLEWSHHPLNRRNGGWLDGNSQGTCWPDITDLENSEHRGYIERYLSYTISRFSAYWNVFWALGAESANLTGEHAEAIARWYRHWGDYVARKDPHGCLQSIGDTGEQPGVIQSPRNNFAITQEHTSMENREVFCDATGRFGRRFWQYGRPAVIGEQDRHNCGIYEEERRGYWTALASGFYMGRVDRHFPVAQEGILYEAILFSGGETPPIYPYLRHLRSFLEESGARYWRMSPHNDLIGAPTGSAYCLAEPGEEYLLYFPAGGSAMLEVPDCRCQWYNPRTGDYLADIPLARGRQRFAAPDEEDWVLHIVRNLSA